MTHAYETHGNFQILCMYERHYVRVCMKVCVFVCVCVFVYVHVLSVFLHDTVHIRAQADVVSSRLCACDSVYLSPSHLVDDRSKVGWAIQLNSPQALEVRL